MKAFSIQRLSGFLVVVVVFVTMFLPMIAVQTYAEMMQGVGANVEAGTVGIGVILRATARRLMRGASSNLMRTTVGTFGRTSLRALTRRLLKFTGRIFVSSMLQQSSTSEERGEQPITLRSQATALLVGYAGLCLSFLGVLHVAGPDAADEIRTWAGLGTTSIVLMAGLPLLVYACFHHVLGGRYDVKVRYRTEVDGLLLQGYFTGAGSFLPLTTDVDYSGDEQGKRNLAVGSILGLFAVHVALVLIGRGLDLASLQFLGQAFLIYAFVYCFPIQPLEGHFIWRSSKLLWALVTLPILVSFLTWLPPAITEIL